MLEVFPFFVGCGRSGTTLMRAMFNAHPAMAVPYESYFLAPMGRAESRRHYETEAGFAVDSFVRSLQCEPGFRQWGIPEEALGMALLHPPPRDYPDAARRVFALYASLQQKPRYGDKTTLYVLNIALLAELFPEARFVHIIRDGRDVALSWLDTGWDFGPQTIEEAALYWRYHVKRGQRSGRALGAERYREVLYEDLLRDPPGGLKTLCEFLELDFDPRMLAYPERAAELLGTMPRPQHHQHLRLPPTKELRSWRRDMPRDDVAHFESLAGSVLEDLGYEVRRGGATGGPSR